MRARVRATDLEGNSFEAGRGALRARNEHETDHLNGRCSSIRWGRVKRELIKRKLRRGGRAEAEEADAEDASSAG